MSPTRFLRASVQVLVAVVAILAVVGILGGSSAWADPYYNSSEPGCDGSNPNVVWCEDFETSGVANSPNGRWYGENCDAANSKGGIDLRTKGWCGNIFNSIDPAGAATCGGVGAGGTNCAGNGGPHIGQIGNINAADHNFAPNRSSYNEIYLRYYLKALPGYTYGAQKMIDFNQCCAGKGGIDFTGVGAPFSEPFLACPVYDCNILTFNNPQCGAGGCPGGAYLSQNQGKDFSFNNFRGHWVFVEMHVKVNSPRTAQNGIYELWMDDCGINGLGCTGTPTLRARYTNVRFQDPAQAGSTQIGSIWMGNWANPGSTGTELYDQIKVATVGPIGFMGGGSAGPAPQAPTALTVR